MIVLFWALFCLILLHYALFPVGVIVYARFLRRPIKKDSIEPTVTLLIAAYNEEDIISAKIRNCLELNYPPERLQILVVSDGSSDATPQIVEAFSHSKIEGLFDPVRRGKSAALNRGMQKARGEIVLFSDANTFYEPNAIRRLVENFADSTVGGVCGRKSILKERGRSSSLGDRLFWGFESALKTAESLIGSIPTADGEIFAIRAALFKPLPTETINDDTAITFDIVRAGFRVIYEPLAISAESASITLREDMRVKSRMVYGGYQSLARYRRDLFPPRSFFAFQFICHKVLRHVMPFLLLAFFLTSCALSGPLYRLALLLQVLFYGLALSGMLFASAGRKVKVFYIPLYYCAMNYSAAVGFYYFLRARSLTQIWTKAAR